MNEATKYLLNRAGQVATYYETQIAQLIALVEEKDAEIARLKTASERPPEPPGHA